MNIDRCKEQVARVAGDNALLLQEPAHTIIHDLDVRTTVRKLASCHILPEQGTLKAVFPRRPAKPVSTEEAILSYKA